MVSIGPLNSICDVAGIRVGNAEDPDLVTGATVVLPDAPAVCAVDHRGGAVGSRDTVAMMPGMVGDRVHAVALSGGSAYGLDAAGGVMHRLRAMGRGFEIGSAVVPIVPSAIIFDLMVGGSDWQHPPWWELGLRATDTAAAEFALGNAGAGMGATAGPLKGGLGTASFVTADYTVGALAVANPVGSTVMPGLDTFWGWHLEQAGELGNQSPPARKPATGPSGPPPAAGANTTLVVIATDAALSREQALRVAIMAQDGLAQTIRPVHSPLDGDTVFVLSTAARAAPDPWHGLSRLGMLAGDAAGRAIMRGVYEAATLAGVSCYRAVHGGG